MSNYVFNSGGLQIGVGANDSQGRTGIAVSGAAQLDAGAIDRANTERARRVGQVVNAARLRFVKELDRLAEAREARSRAEAELESANAELADARDRHRQAMQRADNPTPTRTAVKAAEERLADAVAWVSNASARFQEAERIASDAARAAWGAEVESRRPGLEAEKAKIAKTGAELLNDLANLALAGFAPDGILSGPFPSAELIADGAPSAGLKLAAG